MRHTWFPEWSASSCRESSIATVLGRHSSLSGAKCLFECMCEEEVCPVAGDCNARQGIPAEVRRLMQSGHHGWAGWARPWVAGRRLRFELKHPNDAAISDNECAASELLTRNSHFITRRCGVVNPVDSSGSTFVLQYKISSFIAASR